MFDKRRRNFLSYISLLGFTFVSAQAIPMRLTKEKRKGINSCNCQTSLNAYYGFSETW